MGYNISFKTSVFKDLKKIDKSEAKQILDKIEKELSETPDSYPMLTGKFSGLRRYRIGDYRVIFSIIKDTVLILRIGHRKDAYK